MAENVYTYKIIAVYWTKYFYRIFQVSACLISCFIFHIRRPSKIDYKKNIVKKATIWTSRSNKDGTEEDNYHFNYHEKLKFFDTVHNKDAPGYIKDSVMKKKKKNEKPVNLSFEFCSLNHFTDVRVDEFWIQHWW